jgi:hypothetical protein
MRCKGFRHFTAMSIGNHLQMVGHIMNVTQKLYWFPVKLAPLDKKG